MSKLTVEQAIKVLRANSGYDRETSTWEAQRTLVEYAEAERARESVWILERGERDVDNYMRWTPMLDRGYFLTEDEAGEYMSGIADSWSDFRVSELDKTFGL